MHRITLIPGHGIGPEIIESVKKIIAAMNLPIQWDTFHIDGTLGDDVLSSISENKVALKGPLSTPIGKGYKSLNVSLRQHFDLSTNFRPVKSFHDNKVDLVIFRENTEGLYIGRETKVNDDEYHAIKITTKKASERIIREAFEYAKKHGIDKVTLVHKANILKLTDGLFLNIGHTIENEYEDIRLEPVIVDNMCMQLVMNPSQFKVIVAPNLYGDILSDLCAGLVGGLGVVPGVNYGKGIAIFEAVHGTAPDIAGMNQANPISLLLSVCLMLFHLGYDEAAKTLNQCIEMSIKKGKTTMDLNGSLTTDGYTHFIIHALEVYDDKRL